MSDDTPETLKARITDLERQVGALQAENAALKERLGGADAERLAKNLLAFEQIPVSLGVFRADGPLVSVNAAAEAIFGASREILYRFGNALTDPACAETGTHAIFEQVLRGHAVTTQPYTIDVRRTMPEAEGRGGVVWYETLYFPIRQPDGTLSHVGSMTRDITTRIERQQQLEASRQEILAAEKELAAQRETITALSSPVIQVWEGILTMPLIGVIDAQRAARITQDLLQAIVRDRSRCVILDITGVATVDAQVATYLLSAARACRLLGCEVALVGVGTNVAQTIVRLGVDLSEVITRANLQAGIAWAFERSGFRVVARGGAP
ncbi:MAG TPA: STAS domain-containing protein [Polyangiaceae bacterium]|nr:STAS domain-containing protein [Polyangiaceae bacterium]